MSNDKKKSGRRRGDAFPRRPRAGAKTDESEATVADEPGEEHSDQGGEAAPEASDDEFDTLSLSNLPLALLHAQANVQRPEMKKQGYNYAYIPSNEIIRVCREALVDSGLTLFRLKLAFSPWGTEGVDHSRLNWMSDKSTCAGMVFVTWRLQHALSKEYLDFEGSPWPVVITPGRALDKAMAAAITTSLSYMMRDLLMLDRLSGPEVDDREESSPTPSTVVKETTKKKDEKVIPIDELRKHVEGISPEQIKMIGSAYPEGYPEGNLPALRERVEALKKEEARAQQPAAQSATQTDPANQPAKPALSVTSASANGGAASAQSQSTTQSLPATKPTQSAQPLPPTDDLPIPQ